MVDKLLAVQCDRKSYPGMGPFADCIGDDLPNRGSTSADHRHGI